MEFDERVFSGIKVKFSCDQVDLAVFISEVVPEDSRSLARESEVRRETLSLNLDSMNTYHKATLPPV